MPVNLRTSICNWVEWKIGFHAHDNNICGNDMQVWKEYIGVESSMLKSVNQFSCSWSPLSSSKQRVLRLMVDLIRFFGYFNDVFCWVEDWKTNMLQIVAFFFDSKCWYWIYSSLIDYPLIPVPIWLLGKQRFLIFAFFLNWHILILWLFLQPSYSPFNSLNIYTHWWDKVL